MEIWKISNDVISQEEKEKTGIKSVSIISETDILYPRLIVKYENGLKSYFLMNDSIHSTEDFRLFVEECVPELKK